MLLDVVLIMIDGNIKRNIIIKLLLRHFFHKNVLMSYTGMNSSWLSELCLYGCLHLSVGFWCVKGYD